MFSNLFINRQISGFLVGALVFSIFSLTSFGHTASASTTAYDKNNDPVYISALKLQLLQLQLQLAVLLKMKAELDASRPTPITTRRNYNPFFVQVTTEAPFGVGRNTAELSAKVDKGSSPTAQLSFEYGVGTTLSKDSDTVKITSQRSVISKVRIIDLKPDTTYSYRSAVEDEDGNIIYGQTRTFVTVKEASETAFVGRPVVESEGLTGITASGAELKVFVSMNDYDNGTVFFVRSTDYSKLSKLDDDFDNYAEIPAVNNSGVSKLIVKKAVTERSTVTGRISGLTKATKNYYIACVEYVYRGSSVTITCSDVESFVTAN